jgi:S1-C subfamily serine protease
MAGSTLTSFSNDLAQVVENASRFTVTVNARRRIPATGILYTNELVLTADHVIERDEDITIGFENGKETHASIAGRDPARDIALLRLSQPAEVTAKKAASPARVGHLVVALGRPGSGGIEASMGMVNALGGPVRIGHGSVLEQYIQTDAYPYPGFSGGPLVNLEGEVLGLNTSGLASGSLIAIPVADAYEAASSLASHGKIRRGYLGIRSQPVHLAPAQSAITGRQQSTGLLIVSVDENSPAAEASLMTGDILVGVNQQPVTEHEQLQTFLGSDSVGATLPFDLLRGPTLTQVAVKIRERE